MAHVFLIGIGAGAAAALLFASVASGSPLSVLLFYLAPLPILIAAMGWSHWAALIAALVAATGLAALFGSFFFIAFLLGIGLPAWWLGYLALLARPASTPTAENGLEWYPVGHLVFWAALISGAVVIVGMLNLGTDEASFRAALHRSIERVVRIQGAASGSDGAPALSERVLDIMVTILPVAAAVLSTLTSIVNLGLAARIVKISGRLPRPWPDIAAMRFPSYAPMVAGVAVIGTFVSGIMGMMSSAMMASVLMAYAVLGFAVLHAITRGSASRPFVLGGAYAAVVVFFWPALVLSMLGLADTMFDFRRRAAQKRGPPDAGT
ncbi:MAG TPA: DUF2232 domain-containing protein [Xanthobacteraceae bacterium]|nr:DUF2232 domain-containing protein [Xanthobacteraceae bacterium]